MNPTKIIKEILLFVWSFFVLFFGVAFVVSCSFLLFFDQSEVSDEIIRAGAKITFINVIFLSLLLCIINTVRRKLTVDLPVKRILDATHRITHGDFSARIEPIKTFKATNEFNSIIEDFNIMAKELSSTEPLQTDFLANVSHELKTPLSIIQNYSVMLQTPNLPEEKRLEYSKAVSDAVYRFSEMITNILKLNKLENQQIFPNAEKYNLSEQLCGCLLAFESTWEDKELDINTDIDDDVYITADSELLYYIWNNLFSNAMKFTEPHGKIYVGLKADNEYATVTVSDTGCGMNSETGKHIFNKFYQGDTSHASQGNGLGLALVKRIIDITNSEISVNSELGKGSTFTVKLWRNVDESI